MKVRGGSAGALCKIRIVQSVSELVEKGDGFQPLTVEQSVIRLRQIKILLVGLLNKVLQLLWVSDFKPCPVDAHDTIIELGCPVSLPHGLLPVENSRDQQAEAGSSYGQCQMTLVFRYFAEHASLPLSE